MELASVTNQNDVRCLDKVEKLDESTWCVFRYDLDPWGKPLPYSRPIYIGSDKEKAESKARYSG